MRETTDAPACLGILAEAARRVCCPENWHSIEYIAENVEFE